MRDFLLVLAGMGMGWAAEGVWWRLKPQVDRGLILAAYWLGRVWRRRPQQWFTRSDRPQGARPTTPRPQPGPRPVVGQRPASGAHRATQRQARFGTRTFRRRTKAG